MSEPKNAALVTGTKKIFSLGNKLWIGTAQLFANDITIGWECYVDVSIERIWNDSHSACVTNAIAAQTGSPHRTIRY
jgi:hypothetical protein